MRPKITIRNLIRSRLYSLIIIISLAIGIACVNLIGIFVYKEYHADAFHKNKDCIYALLADDPWIKGDKVYYIDQDAAEYMKKNYPEIRDFCMVSNSNPSKVTIGKTDYFDDKLIIAASSNFFSFFSYPLLSNKSQYVLETKHDIVISENIAKKYFGSQDPVGQNIIFTNGDQEEELTVSGVFRKPKESTQLNFDMVKLIEENHANARSYILTKPDVNIEQLEKKFDRDKASVPNAYMSYPAGYYLKDLQSAYFDTSRDQTIEKNRNKTDLKIAMVIAILIISVALFNYIGLINTRIMDKAREHSIRKINGGSRGSLINNLLSETLILTVIAFLISLPLMNLVIPFFNKLTSSSITLSYILVSKNIIFLFIIPILILLSSVLFAILRISKGVPVETLKPGKFQSFSKAYIPVFNITQLAISIILMVGSAVIMKQINYITNKDIGIDKNVIEVKIPPQYNNIINIFKAELEKNTSIEMISLANTSPVSVYFTLLLKYKENGIEKQYTPSVFVGDENYTKTLGVKIINGEDFSDNAESNAFKCIINQSLAKLFPDQDLIGEKLPGENNTTIIGISNDFHYSSLDKYIEPGYIAYSNNGHYMLVKPALGKTAEVRGVISSIWAKLITDYPLNIETVGERYEWRHRENANYAKLIGSCCIISIFLSMMGLFAVSLYTSQRRIKEIGIRKVNGARIGEILVMLNKNFIIWNLIAFVISFPIAWYAMHKWLQNFAYKTTLSWCVFAAAGIAAVAVALLTVSWQSWRAATRNPVEALRYE